MLFFVESFTLRRQTNCRLFFLQLQKKAKTQLLSKAYWIKIWLTFRYCLLLISHLDWGEKNSQQNNLFKKIHKKTKQNENEKKKRNNLYTEIRWYLFSIKMLNLSRKIMREPKINQKHYFHHSYSSTYHTRTWRENKKLKLRHLKMYHWNNAIQCHMTENLWIWYILKHQCREHVTSRY